GLLAEVHVERGAALYQAGLQEEARQAYDAALKIVPNFAPALRLRGLVLLDLHRYGEAIHDLDSCLKQEKDGEFAAVQDEARGLARGKLNDYAGAIDDYSQALQLAPTGRLHSLRGWLHAIRGTLPFALNDFEEAIRLDKNSSDAHAGRGYARVKLGHLKEAI